ncbi:hypothetical protein BH23BAC3_BH23BAC3_28770 [soil metagenome]
MSPENRSAHDKVIWNLQLDSPIDNLRTEKPTRFKL